MCSRPLESNHCAGRMLYNGSRHATRYTKGLKKAQVANIISKKGLEKAQVANIVTKEGLQKAQVANIVTNHVHEKALGILVAGWAVSAA